MDLFVTETQFILVNSDKGACLWISRLNGEYQMTKGTTVPNAECLGKVYGFLGTLQVSQAADTRLVFIRQQALVGNLKESPIFRITSVLTIPLEGDTEIVLEPSPLSNNSQWYCDRDVPSLAPSTPTRQPPTSDNGIDTIDSQMIRVRVPPVQSRSSRKNETKVDRRMLDEFSKMFTEANSFYYSPFYDITNSYQRLQTESKKEDQQVESQKRLGDGRNWKTADTRFFWNWHMIQTLATSEKEDLQEWILPIMQGFIECETCTIEQPEDPFIGPVDLPVTPVIEIWLIARRSRFQAGTRYLRRGINNDGKVANYVETEQLVVYKGHIFSFLLLRGSIPVFWSQASSYRYRPPPKLEKDDAETFKAFKKHFDEELSIYQEVSIINLVEKTGKEKPLGDAYIRHVLRLDSDKIVYVTFDFHDECRGMRFENVKRLTHQLHDVLRKIGYCWVDQYGIVLKQEGVIRVNCVDCLDRTNVVQTHLATEMLTYELSKVGLIAPEIGLPSNVNSVLRTLWANHGDIISKQYAGTNALKGDFTRTGERKLTGLMKDGMNSANRYYLNRFRDTSRQAAIDIMLGVRKSVTEAELTEDRSTFERDSSSNNVEQVKTVIEDVKRCVVPSDEVVLGAWGLVNGKVNETEVIDIDLIYVLTEKNVYIAEYDCTADSMTDVETLNLNQISGIELGFERLTHGATVWNIFSGNTSKQVLLPTLCINVTLGGDSQSFLFRSSNIRFFNNVAIPIQQPEEMHEALKMIAEATKVAMMAQGNNVEIKSQKIVATVTKPRIPGMASNFAKYFNPRSQLGRKETPVPPSQDFSKGQEVGYSGMEVAPPEVGIDVCAADMIGGFDLPEQPPSRDHMHLAVDGSMIDNYSSTHLTPQTQTPRLSLAHLQDIVLPSCGILSPARRNFPEVTLAESILFVTEPSYSPTTPALEVVPVELSPRVSPTRFAAPVRSTQLKQHRHSLPTNTLNISGEDSIRARTPEITITEETLSENLDTASANTGFQLPSTLSVAIRRISRSTEDITKGHSIGFGIPMIGNMKPQGSFKLSNIFQGGKSDSRSSSQQNIHTAGQSFDITSPSYQKRETGLFPLGKLAKGVQNLGASYLDPRKLRESFKPATKPEFEDKELEERKQRSQTKFIDL